jgi:hypothetical protein
MMSVRLAGWAQDFDLDLDIMLDTIAGRTEWTTKFEHPLPEVLPPGSRWAESLPAALAWAATADHPEAQLKQMQLKRGCSLFPSA